MKAYRGVDVQMHIFLTLALVGGEWSASHPCHFTPKEKAPNTHWIRGWVGPRASLDAVEQKKFLTLLGPLVIQPVASHYANYAIPLSLVVVIYFIYLFIYLWFI
jgi:hypothetical protein